MTTREQQENVDHLAIIISNYIGQTDVGFENIAVLDGLFESLHISPVLEKWWRNRVVKALLQTKKEDN